MSIQLIIKSPNQQVDDIKVDCDLTWSVGRIKDHLCDAYPTKPIKSQQKIIYCGRLLPDHLLLKEVLTQDQDVHTMHLVCPQSTNLDKSHMPPPKYDQPLNNAPTNVLPSSTDGLRQRLIDPQQYISSVNSLYSQMQPTAAATATPSPYLTAYQLAAFQQTYAQFVAQCFAQQNQPGPSNEVRNAPQREEQNNHPAVVNQANQEANVAANAAEEEPVDMLDRVYVMTRLAMLVAVLYFYSTWTRIALILGLAFLFYICRVVVSRSQPRRRTTVVVPESSSTVPPESPANEESVNETPVPEETGPSKLVIAFTFVKTLFTSLIPERPVPMEGN